MMIVLSLMASLRYMYWRLTETIGFEGALDTFFGWGLVLAEIYTLIILLLGFFQTAWPLKRQPVTLPRDANLWPIVDVFIPTYNEPLSVVQITILAAQTMDWPADKLRISVLDDGKRSEFAEFCKEAGVNYLTRDNNLHNKAGNLNAALLNTSGEYVVIFDCDHTPTRSFLQVCMGWFLRDENLAMLQTPHFFFSPDPFEKNLSTFRLVPNEGDLFYGLAQDGNDLWNASFFCGSCAILRRAPLMEVGGIAIETVTEDAHTALKLSRKGYNTAYIGIPLAAGLATESLSGHIKQRIRWARGMGQIFRVDNPIFGKGLTAGQRMCYLNAMLHFFYGLPRLVFLTAPLAYLFFDAHVFQASAFLVMAYVIPHIFLSNLANSRLQGQFRHSFWNEIYETVLAWYIFFPVLLALINPKIGAFNVTAKGGVIEEDFYDWKLARPYLMILALNICGFVVGIYMLTKGDRSVATTSINLVWVLYNIIIISASAGVADEKRQIRTTNRVEASIPATIKLPDGKTVVCKTTDFSSNGLGLELTSDISLPPGTKVNISLFRGEKEIVLPGTVFRSGSALGLKFENLRLDQQREFTEISFSRADNWANTWGKAPRVSPLMSLKEIILYGLGNIIPLASKAVLSFIKDGPLELEKLKRDNFKAFKHLTHLDKLTTLYRHMKFRRNKLSRIHK